MMKIILTLLLAALAVGLIAVAMQPDTFRVTRSATFSVPAEIVFEQVNDLHKWENWSPWRELDPNAKSTYEGPIAGEGATMHWDGNQEVGKGSMTITQSRPNELIQFKLAFLKPMESTSTAEFTFKPEGENTVVTWSMYGENNFIGKALHLVFDCEKMVGDQFEKGLANLRSIVEVK